MGQPVRMLTSGNLDVRGLQDGSLHNFLLPANNRCLLVLSENRGFFICYLSMTEEFLLLIVLLLLVVLVWELVLVVVVGLCVMVSFVSLKFPSSSRPSLCILSLV